MSKHIMGWIKYGYSAILRLLLITYSYIMDYEIKKNKTAGFR